VAPSLTETTPPSSVSPTPSTPPTDLPSDEAGLLHACALDLDTLKRAKDLRAVIAQVESGEVGRIRQRYGPEKGRKPHPEWANMKVTVTRRERVYEQLEKEFSGNKDQFFYFFTVVNADGTTALRPYRKIAEAIPWKQRDIEAERALPCYHDLSGSLWEQKWAGKNGWEIWRALGKERYN
jgi:hypothetical protein